VVLPRNRDPHHRHSMPVPHAELLIGVSQA
jgi:hypothetical protein